MPEYRLKPGGMHDQALRGRKKVQIIGGGFGNGKTALCCVKASMLAKAYPGSNGLIAMATYAALNDTIRKEFYKWMPASAIKRMATVTDNTVHLKNGTIVNFRYLQQRGKQLADGQTSSNLLSATYDWIIVDQIENPSITYKDFLDLLGRLRGSTPYRGSDETMPETGPRWLILAANPSFNWVYHKLIKPIYTYQKTGQITDDLMVNPDTMEPMIELFEGSTYENAHNLEPDFIRSLEAAYKGQFRERFLEGKWGAFEGLVYPDFSHDAHMLPKSRIMQHVINCRAQGLRLQAIEGFDWGLAAPSCYLFGFTDPWGRIFILDGFYRRNMTLQDIGEGIHSIRNKYFGYIEIDMPILADPAIYRRTPVAGMGKGVDTIQRFLSDGYDLNFRPGHNDVLSGIAKVSAYLTVRNFPDFITKQPNAPIIFFNNELFFIADEFGSYFWQTSTGTERIDKPIDKNDHAMDTLKYIVSYLPEVTELLFHRKLGAA